MAPPAAKPVPAGALSGWLRVDVPIAMRISEDGRLLGTTDVDRLMLPTGDHLLDLRNEELGFTTRQMVTIKAGETSILPVRLPSASISINAKAVGRGMGGRRACGRHAYRHADAHHRAP